MISFIFYKDALDNLKENFSGCDSDDEVLELNNKEIGDILCIAFNDKSKISIIINSLINWDEEENKEYSFIVNMQKEFEASNFEKEKELIIDIIKNWEYDPKKVLESLIENNYIDSAYTVDSSDLLYGALVEYFSKEGE